MNKFTQQQAEYLMDLALDQARLAAQQNEVPVGAVISEGANIISAAYNLTESTHNPAGHAEILALQSAAKKLKNWRLNELTLTVSLEPCPMCMAALKHARIKTLIFGAADSLRGACGSAFDLSCNKAAGPVDLTVISGIRAAESELLLKKFFGTKRLKAR